MVIASFVWGRRKVEKAFCEVKCCVVLELYKRDGLESSGKEPDDESDASGARTSEKEDDSACVTTNPALVFQPNKEVYLWGETLARESWNIGFKEKPYVSETSRLGSLYVVDNRFWRSASARAAPFRSLRSGREGVLDVSLPCRALRGIHVFL